MRATAFRPRLLVSVQIMTSSNPPESRLQPTASPPPSRKQHDPGGAPINRIVFFGAAIGVVVFALWAMLFRDNAKLVIGTCVEWVGQNFGWYYSAVIVLVLAFVIAVAISKMGRIRLGPDHSRPTFNLFTWTAMLFAAGIGIDLMFFSVSEPITQYLAPPTGDGETVEAARQALTWTLFHYGILGWGLYALMGMALGYFAYRHNLPLSIRSALFPILGKRIHGWLGDLVDIAAVLGTIFGIATSLGIGVAQLNYGLEFMFGIPQSTGTKIGLIALSVVMATISVLTGVEKGIRRLSELNVLLSIALMIFVLIAGRTSYLFDGIVLNVGDTLSRFPSMALDTFAYDRPDAWLNAWTLFFWAWWIAWAPFVGLFLARISRGRTLRQFIVGVLAVPFAFILLWISIFGNSALDLVRQGNTAFGEMAMNHPEQGFYGLLDQLPWVPVTAAVATFTGLLFYVTSADSGALVMSNFTSKLKDPEADGAKWVRVFWAIATGLLTLSMLLVDGVPTLQNATVIMGLPFSVVLLFIMLGLYKALRVESALAGSFRAGLQGVLASRAHMGSADSRRGWRHRLSRAVSYPGRRSAQRFITDVARPALEAVRTEFTDQGIDATLDIESVEGADIDTLNLIVQHGDERAFKYQIYPVQMNVPTFATASVKSETFYRMEVFSIEGSHGYDLLGCTVEQVIADVLDQYEVHMAFLLENSGGVGASKIAEDVEETTVWDSVFHPITEGPEDGTPPDPQEPRNPKEQS